MSEEVEGEEAEERERTVENGVLQGVSVSQIQNFDPTVYGGCNRKWWFDKVARIKRPDTKATLLGKSGHKEIENYLETGVDTLGPIARAGKRFMPDPMTFLYVEHKLSGLDVHGVKFKGSIDLVNYSETYRDDEGVLHDDPGTVEVGDWKFIRDLRYAKKGNELKTVQMVGYAAYVARRDWGLSSGPLQRVRLSHGTFATEGRPTAIKTTITIGLDEIQAERVRVEGVVGDMKRVAGLKVIEDVEPTLESCNAFKSKKTGKGGCPYTAICPRSAVQKLSFMGGKHGMSLLRRINPAPAAPPATPVTETPAAAPDMAAELAKLEAEEKAAKTATPERIPGMYYHLPAGGKVQAWKMPDGSTAPNDPDPKINAACEGLTPAKFDAPPAVIRAVGVTPPDAPVSLPPASADPIPPETLAGMHPAIREAAKAFAAEGATVEVVNTNVADGAGGPASPPIKVTKKRGRPPKAENAAPPTTAERDAIAAELDRVAMDTEAAPPAPAPSAFEALKAVAEKLDKTAGPIEIMEDPVLALYVDVITDGVEVTSLEPYIANALRAMENTFNVSDVRCAPKDSPLAYGGWKGILAAGLRAEPPPPAAYTILDVRESEVKAVVVEALRPLATTFVRGR